MRNKDIRFKALEKNVKHYEIAEKLGTNSTYFSKKLREEFPEDEKKKIFAIIDQIAKERGCSYE